MLIFNDDKDLIKTTRVLQLFAQLQNILLISVKILHRNEIYQNEIIVACTVYMIYMYIMFCCVNCLSGLLTKAVLNLR